MKIPLLNYFKNIKSFSILVIPDDTSHSTQSRQFTMTKFVTMLILYSLIIFIGGFYLITLTGVNRLLLPGKYGINIEDSEKISELNNKMIFLAKELQGLKATNRRLMYSLILSDSTYTDSLPPSNTDSAFDQETFPAGGNILQAVMRLFKSDHPEKESIFFIKPAEGFISRKYDTERGHLGIDIVTKEGSPVYASAGGFVVFADYTVDYGYTVIISHSDSYLTFYKHCSALLKKEREEVQQGEMIALSGNSGTLSSGPHLHFEIWKDGKTLDPLNLIVNY
jgi:murein DD-endopeptidase MepM/ murein hydrolase activator NlpD